MSFDAAARNRVHDWLFGQALPLWATAGIDDQDRFFEKLDFDYVLEMGCDLFAEDPLLHRNDPARARRLAWLIAHKTEGVNAALFAAPDAGCAPELVEPRFCALPDMIMRQLQARAAHGRLSAVAADKAVWGRMAA